MIRDMKKSLFIGMAMIATAAAFTSCEQKPEPKPQGNTINSHVEYIDPFNRPKYDAPTRACDVNGNQWATKPEIPTAAEVEGVLAYIATQPEAVNFPADCDTFFVQHVGGAHHMYSYKDWNGAWHTNIDGTSTMEQLKIKENSGNWQHVYNFNAGKCENAATNNAARMTDGFNGATTLNEYSSSLIENYRVYMWNGAYYLGMDFSAKKGDGEIPGDLIFDDWVVKLIPINYTPVDPEERDSAAHVEFDIHQQEHKDWREIKTSIHLRDTVDVHILLPIPDAYQAECDDFAIRAGEKYEYIMKTIQIAGEEFNIEFVVKHTAEGIDIRVGGANCAAALRAARNTYQDGLTFEVHTYVNWDTTDDQMVWNWLKTTQCPDVSPVTHVFGQVTSAFYPAESIFFDENAPEE